MMEKRLRIVEETLTTYGRRHDDCEKERREMNLALQEILSWKHAIQESTEVNRKMVEVGENMLVLFGWVFAAAKWISIVGGAFAMFFAAFKWVYGKVV